MRKLILVLAAPLSLLAAGDLASAAAKTAAEQDYGRNLISVATPGRHAPSARTADCIVWINAEGLGVGPAQLGGLHGLAMHLNEKPLANEGRATSFEAGLAALKAEQPKAPAWLFTALEKNREAIRAACAEDHEEPVKVYGLTAKDKG